VSGLSSSLLGCCERELVSPRRETRRAAPQLLGWASRGVERGSGVVQRRERLGRGFIAERRRMVDAAHLRGALVHWLAIGQLGRWGSVVWFRPGELAKLQREAREA
jgi:hypothetical protein